MEHKLTHSYIDIDVPDGNFSGSINAATRCWKAADIMGNWF